MSGYDPFTGVFELIAARVHRWLRRDTAYVGGNTSMERAANLLAQEGLKVLFVSESYLLIRARPAAIWTALTGEPSTRKHRDDYTASPGKGIYRDEPMRSLHWSPDVLDVLGLKWRKPPKLD